MHIKRFIKVIKSLPKGARVLDAGCGSGNNSRYLRSIRPDLNISAIDIDRSHKDNVPSYVDFSVMSVEDMKGFKDKTFDLILCFHVLEHLLDPFKAVSEFNRVLKKQGFICAESPHWISTVMPFGYNFYDDPTHVRPFNSTSFNALFTKWNIRYLGFETPIFYYLDRLYKLKRFSFGFMFRRLLNFLGLYRTAIFIIAVKR